MRDDDKPATKGFVRESINELSTAVKVGFDNTATKEDVSDLKKDITGLKKDTTGLKKDVASLKRGQQSLTKDVVSLKQGQEAMLGILDENNQLLKEIRRLPERVERLERSVFRR